MKVRTQIELREGVKVSVLVTPALYRIAERKGLDVTGGDATAQDPFTSYIRILYCAAVNAWEVDTVDKPDMGAFPYTYAEFVEWAWSDVKRLGESVSFIYEALTGKTLKNGVEEVKKKMKKR